MTIGCPGYTELDVAAFRMLQNKKTFILHLQ
jgi:hypothetical protein